MAGHQCWISVVVSQTSFCGETSGGVANVGCLLRLLFCLLRHRAHESRSKSQFFNYRNKPSVHAKPVIPHTGTASFLNPSPEWIFLDPTGLANSCRRLKRYFSIQLRHKLRSRLKWELANLKWLATTLLGYCSSNSTSISERLDWTAIATRRFPLAATSCSRSIF